MWTTSPRRRSVFQTITFTATTGLAGFVVLVVGLMRPPRASGDTIVISPGFPNVNTYGTAYAVHTHWSYSFFVPTSTAVSAGNSGDATATGKSATLLPQDSSSLSGPADFGVMASAQGSWGGSVSIPKIKGSIDTLALAGTATAQVSLEMDYIDLFHAQNAGELDFTVKQDGLVTSQADATNPNVASASSDVEVQAYFWPVTEGVPQGGQGFTATTYEQIVIGPNSTTDTGTPAPLTVPANSFWWVAVRVSFLGNAAVNTNTVYAPGDTGDSVETTANFSNTVALHLDPDPSTPNFTYTMASGVNYLTPTPEPATALLLLLGSAVLCCPRHPARPQQQHGPTPR